MSELSTKPYLLRAIYEWCTDSGYTPYLAVAVDAQTRVPMEFVKNGEIVLNISFSATSGLKMDNDLIHFHARFGGVSREISVPVENVIAIYANENGQGMAFEAPKPAEQDANFDDAAPAIAEVVPEAGSTGPTLSAVPSKPADTGSVSDGKPDGGPSGPPKKSGKPTLTRIK